MNSIEWRFCMNLPESPESSECSESPESSWILWIPWIPWILWILWIHLFNNSVYCPKGLLCRDLSNFSVRPSSVCLSVRPSVTLSSGPGFCETCMPGTQSAFKTGSVRDILQNLVPTKTIRVSHLPIPVSPEISPRGYNSNDLTYSNIVASARKIWVVPTQ